MAQSHPIPRVHESVVHMCVLHGQRQQHLKVPLTYVTCCPDRSEWTLHVIEVRHAFRIKTQDIKNGLQNYTMHLPMLQSWVYNPVSDVRPSTHVK